MTEGEMHESRDARCGEPGATGARRLLWMLVIGIVVLNLLIFLATQRKDSGEAAVPDGVGTERGRRTNAP